MAGAGVLALLIGGILYWFGMRGTRPGSTTAGTDRPNDGTGEPHARPARSAVLLRT
jgi:hypothetical protein